jgi:hypothetical protein
MPASSSSARKLSMDFSRSLRLTMFGGPTCQPDDYRMEAAVGSARCRAVALGCKATSVEEFVVRHRRLRNT